MKKQIDINSIPAEKLQLATSGVTFHDKKLLTKPKSYMKDAWIRFKKNKSSVVAACIIGFLILFSIVVPIFSPYTLADTDMYYRNLPPYVYGSELINGGKDKDLSEVEYFNYKLWEYETGTKIINKLYGVRETVKADGTVTRIYSTNVNQYTKLGAYTWNFTVEDFKKMQEWQDETGIQLLLPMNDVSEATLGFKISDSSINSDSGNYWYKIDKTGNPLDANGKRIQPTFDENYELTQETIDQLVQTHVKYTDKGQRKVQEAVVDENGDPVLDENGNQVYTTKFIYIADLYQSEIGRNEDGTYDYDYYKASGTVIDSEDGTPKQIICRVLYSSYFLYTKGYNPGFLFGTECHGRDIFVSIAIGARFSLLLAVCVSVINFLIGMIYGSVEGYYGGAVDMVLERVSDILSGIPFMVVVSLITFYKAAPDYDFNPSPVFMLVIAYILTGWIGTASLVRKQFYRFKGQEYVTVAKSLGAKDSRIMFKHIFPNSLGTIVTSCALMIPSVISSETMLTYLGIINVSSDSVTTVGVMLSEVENFMETPHAMIVPSLYLALMLISFNLFGNGLRDAFNPSLRGSED